MPLYLFSSSFMKRRKSVLFFLKEKYQKKQQTCGLIAFHFARMKAFVLSPPRHVFLRLRAKATAEPRRRESSANINMIAPNGFSPTDKRCVPELCRREGARRARASRLLQAIEPYQVAQNEARSSDKTLVASFCNFFFQKEKV